MFLLKIKRLAVYERNIRQAKENVLKYLLQTHIGEFEAFSGEFAQALGIFAKMVQEKVCFCLYDMDEVYQRYQEENLNPNQALNMLKIFEVNRVWRQVSSCRCQRHADVVHAFKIVWKLSRFFIRFFRFFLVL